MTMTQEEIDSKNRNFWQELCGTQLATQLGIVDFSLKSLAKFDDFYINYYPYLKKYLYLDALKDKNVLEVGLGYGTVSQLLAKAGANYHGLDIAENAVAMARHRLEQHHLRGDVRVGSMLDCPFDDNYFDQVVSIGCFHHTGDMQACVDQTYRILKKGGRASIMVYNQFSLRQWTNWPLKALKNYLAQYTGEKIRGSSEAQRKAYDASGKNEAAPETEFFSKKNIHSIFKQFNKIEVTCENFDENFNLRFLSIPIHKFKARSELLNSKLARYFGLDLYIEATK